MTTTPTPTFAERIRTYRLRAKLGQKALADALEIDISYVSKMEKAGWIPARPKIERAAEVLGLSTDERDELLLLAAKVPSDVEALLVRDPAAVVFYRSVSRLPEAEQADVLRRFVREIEATYGDGEKQPPSEGEE